MVEEKDGARIKKNAPVLNDSQELLNEFRVRAMNNWCISHTWSHCTDSSWPKLYAHKHAVCKSGTSLCHGHWANVEFITANTKHSKRSTRILNIWNEKQRREIKIGWKEREENRIKNKWKMFRSQFCSNCDEWTVTFDGRQRGKAIRIAATLDAGTIGGSD